MDSTEADLKAAIDAYVDEVKAVNEKKVEVKE